MSTLFNSFVEGAWLISTLGMVIFSYYKKNEWFGLYARLIASSICGFSLIFKLAATNSNEASVLYIVLITAPFYTVIATSYEIGRKEAKEEKNDNVTEENTAQ